MRSLLGSSGIARSIRTGGARLWRCLREGSRLFLREAKRRLLRDGTRDRPSVLRGLLAALILVLLAPTVHGGVPEAPLAVPRISHALAAPGIAHGMGDLAQAEAVGADWMSGIQRHLAAREYAAGPNAQGLQAPNRAHNLRTYFDATGIQIVDRTAASSPELLALRLASIGRGAQPLAVAPGEVWSAGARSWSGT